jgi:ribA/ribD-fused uncharacterized protein
MAAQAAHYGRHELAEIWTRGTGVHQVRHRRMDASNPKHIKSWASMVLGEAKRRNPGLKREWDRKKASLMYHLNWRKYRQFPLLRSTLLATGRAYLVEASPTDDFWGVGRRLSPSELQLGPCHHRKWGTNTMGNILMRIRQNIVRWQRRLHYPSRRMIRRNSARQHLRERVLHQRNPLLHAEPTPLDQLETFHLQLCPAALDRVREAQRVHKEIKERLAMQPKVTREGPHLFSSPPQLPSPTCLRAPASVPLSSDSQRSGQDGRGNVRVDRKMRAAGRYLSPSVPTP